MDNYAIASYPGVQQIESCTVSFAAGITPARIRLQVTPVPAANIAQVGDFVLAYNSQTITFSNCFAHRGDYRFDASGRVLSLVLWDFRWEWEHKRVVGRYNVRDSINRIITISDQNGDTPNSPNENDVIGYSERTPQELAGILLDALDVPNDKRHVSNLPNDARPSMQWDYARPDQELQRLCGSLNCVICVDPDGTVRIERRGQGPVLPPQLTPVLEDGGTVVEAKPVPRKIFVVTNIGMFESDLKLEAVGLDTDKKIKPINDLSYAPKNANGEVDWTTVDVKTMMKIGKDDTPKAIENWRLATLSVYRWYRFTPIIDEEDDPSWLLSDWKYIEQLSPVRDELLEKDEDTGRHEPGFVWGVFARGFYDLFNGGTSERINRLNDIPATAPGQPDEKFRIDDAYTINHDLGIVQFNRALYRVTDEETLAPAILVLRGTHPFRNLKTNVAFRFEFGFDVQGGAQSPIDRFERRYDLKPWAKTWTGQQQDDWETNQDDLEQQAEAYAQELLRDYVIPNSETATYVGIWQIPLSGTILNVTWSFNASGSSTVAAYNADPGGPLIESEVLRKRTEMLKSVTDFQYEQITEDQAPTYDSDGRPTR